MIWLLIIAVVVVGLFFILRRPKEKDEMKEQAEDIKEKTEDLTKRPGGALTDGTYTGRSDTDDHGSYGSIDITVGNNKITDASYTEYLDTGEPKGADYPYQLALEAWPKLEEQLVDKQDPDEVDDIAGATGTSDKFKAAAKRALEKAK